MTPSDKNKKVVIPHDYPVLLRPPLSCAMERRGPANVPAPHVALGGLPRRGEDPARTGEGGAPWTRQYKKIQSYLTASAVNLKRLAAAVAARIFALWRACAARGRRMRTHRAIVRRAGLLSAAA